MAEGLTIDLAVEESRALKQVDDFVAKAKAKLSKIHAAIDAGNQKVAAATSFRSSRSEIDRELDYNLRQRSQALEQARRQEEEQRRREVRAHNASEQKKIDAYLRDQKARVASEQAAADEVRRINADSLRKLEAMHKASKERIARMQNDARSAVQGVLALGSNASVDEAIKANKKVDAARLAGARETLAKVIAAEEAAGRRIAAFRIKENAKGERLAVPVDPYGTGTRRGTKASSRGISNLFQIQQSFEDFQYAGFRGLSNNLAFMASNIKNAKLAAVGLWGVIAVGAADALGLFDELSNSVNKYSDGVQRLIDLEIARVQAIQDARSAFETAKPKSVEEADKQVIDVANQRRALLLQEDLTSEMNRTLAAAERLKASYQIGGRISPQDRAAAERQLLDFYGPDFRVGGSGEGLQNVIDDLKKRIPDRRVKEQEVNATLREREVLLRREIDRLTQIEKHFANLRGLESPSEIVHRLGETPEETALSEVKKKIQEADEQWKKLQDRILEGRIHLDEFNKEHIKIQKNAQALAAEHKKANDQLEFAKDVERAVKDLKQEQIEAERDKLSTLRQQQRENESLIEQEKRKAIEARRNAQDSRHGFESNAFGVGRGLTQRYTDRQLQVAKAMDRAMHPFQPQVVQEFRDKLHDQIFSQIAYARDTALVDARLNMLGKQSTMAGKSGDFDRQRRLLEEMQGLQLDVASSDPSMARSAQMFKAAEKTQRLIEQTFAKQAQQADARARQLEQSNRGLTNSMGSLEAAIRALEQAVSGVNPQARAAAQKQLGQQPPAAPAAPVLPPPAPGIAGGAGVAGGAGANAPAAGGRVAGNIGGLPAGGFPGVPAFAGVDLDDIPAAPGLPPRKAMAKALQDAAQKRKLAEIDARKRWNDKLRAAQDKSRQKIDARFQGGNLAAGAEMPGDDDKRFRYQKPKRTAPFRYTQPWKGLGPNDPGVWEGLKSFKFDKNPANLDDAIDKSISRQKLREKSVAIRDRVAAMRASQDAAKEKAQEAIRLNTQKANEQNDRMKTVMDDVKNNLNRVADNIAKAQQPLIINNFFSGGPGALPSINTIPQGPVDRMGNPLQFGTGARVPGVGNHDTVPAMLTPGEVVLNHAQQARLSRMIGLPPSGAAAIFGQLGVPGFSSATSLGNVRMIGAPMPYSPAAHFAGGGLVRSSSVTSNTTSNTRIGGITINVKSTDEAGAVMARMRTEERAALLRRGS